MNPLLNLHLFLKNHFANKELYEFGSIVLSNLLELSSHVYQNNSFKQQELKAIQQIVQNTSTTNTTHQLNQLTLDQYQPSYTINPLVDYFFYLEEWTSHEQFRIIYDSDIMPLRQKELQNVLLGRKEVLILFETTENELFGGCFEEVISKNDYGYCEDFNSFVFSIRGPNLRKPTKCPRINDLDDLCCFSLYFADNPEYIIDVENAFTLYCPLNSPVSQIDSSFKTSFKNTENVQMTRDPKKFALSRILIIQME
ncbi:TLDc domain-containing protein [Entamoeba marina]